MGRLAYKEVILTVVTIGSSVIAPAAMAVSAVGEPDPVEVLSRDPGRARELGISKLTPSERAAWSRLLAAAFAGGEAACGTGSQHGPPGMSGGEVPGLRPPSTAVGTGGIYRSKIESDENDVLKLENGAIVEVVTGYLGYVGYRKDAILFRRGSNWRLWVEGKSREYGVNVLRLPASRAVRGELVSLASVKGAGAILVLLDGRVLEVSEMDRIYTSLWLGGGEAILLEGGEFINLSESGDLITVTPVR